MPSASSPKPCGKVVAYFIAREGSYYACALEAGHDGPCRASGNCVRHGLYFGEPAMPPQCPHWPTCCRGIAESETP